MERDHPYFGTFYSDMDSAKFRMPTKDIRKNFQVTCKSFSTRYRQSGAQEIDVFVNGPQSANYVVKIKCNWWYDALRGKKREMSNWAEH